MAISHKILIGIGALLLLAFTVMAAYLAEPLWLLLPVLAIGLIYLVQQPILLFYVLLFSIPWSVEYLFPNGLGTDLPDEPLMLLVAFSAAILAMAQRNKSWRTRLHPFIILLILQFSWLAITVGFSTHVILSGKYLLAKAWYLMAFVVTPLLLWQNEKVLRRSVIVLLSSMLLVTTVVLVRHGISGFTFSQINEALQPFFRNHVNYSALLVFLFPLQLLCWQLTKRKGLRTLILLSLAITVPALYLSFARGAWLALLTGSMTYLLLKKRWLYHSFIGVIIFITSTVVWLKQDDNYLQFAHDYNTTIFHQDFEEHLAATYQLKDVSTAERFYRWIAGVRMSEDSWSHGFGPATFYQHYKSYTVPAFKTWVSKNEEQSTVHNYFLLLLIEQGVLGLLLFLILLGMLFWYAQKIYHQTSSIFWKRSVAAIAAILVMQCTLNFLSDLVETDKAGSVFYLCIAALIIADRKTKIEQTSKENKQNQSK